MPLPTAPVPQHLFSQALPDSCCRKYGTAKEPLTARGIPKMQAQSASDGTRLHMSGLLVVSGLDLSSKTVKELKSSYQNPETT